MVTGIRPSLGQLHLAVAFDDVAFGRNNGGRIIKMGTIAKRGSNNRVNLSIATFLENFFLGSTELSGGGVSNDIFEVAGECALGKDDDADLGPSSFTNES